MKLFAIAVVLLMGKTAQAATLWMNGLFYSPEAMNTGSADGAFFLRLSGQTLSYTISTRSIAALDLPAAGFSVVGGGQSIVLPLTQQAVTAFSGCGLDFRIIGPASFWFPDNPSDMVPLGITDPGNCHGYFQMGQLTGVVQLSQEQLSLFERPEFRVELLALRLQGQTDPEIAPIPEPGISILCALAGGFFWRHRRISPR